MESKKNNNLFDTIMSLLFGISAFVLGLSAFFEGGFYSRKEHTFINFGGYPKIAGVLLIVVGFLMISTTIKKIIK